MKRPFLAASALAITGVMLVGCSSSGSGDGGDAKGSESSSELGFKCTGAGSASKSIKVSGKHGKEVKITDGTPVDVKKQQTTVVTEGKGRELKDGDQVTANISLFNAETGKSVASQKVPVTLEKNQVQPWIGKALACGKTRSRLVSVAPVSSIWKDVSQTGLQGLEQDGSVILVFDLLGAQPSDKTPKDILKKAKGESKKLPEGFPEVKLAKNGEPTITIPKGLQPPQKLKIATLIEGDGEKVKAGDRVWVNYKGIIWRTGKEFDSSWKRGEPVSFNTEEVIPGFQKALVGKRVGSQIIAVVPANDGGYGSEALKQQGHQPDDVMVFVLDILATAHAE